MKLKHKIVIGSLFYIILIISLSHYWLNLLRFKSLRDYYITKWLYGILRYLIGLKIFVHGDYLNKKGLGISNHLSWLDILVLGSLPKLRFIAKHNLIAWPIIGAIIKSQVISVNREEKYKIQEQIHNIQSRIELDDKFWILFPEGTTGDSKFILPFKTSLLQIVNKDVFIQPIFIRYSKSFGLPLTLEEIRSLTWQGPQTITPNLVSIINRRQIVVDVYFLEPININNLGLDINNEKALRKALGKYLYDKINSQYQEII